MEAIIKKNNIYFKGQNQWTEDIKDAVVMDIFVALAIKKTIAESTNEEVEVIILEEKNER